MKKIVKIVGVESDMKKVTLLENSGEVKKDGEPKYSKYKIWIKKKDGTSTKAYTQFQKINPKVGDSFELEVAEEQKEFNGFPYTDRTVMFFYIQDEHGTPTTPQEVAGWPTSPLKAEMPPVPTLAPDKALTDALLKIATRIKDLENKIEQQRWYLDELLKKQDPQWKSLSQDEVRDDEIPQ